MAAAAASLLSAAGRRLSRSSASTIICREVTGHHKLTIAGFAPQSMPTETIPTAISKPFEVAGYSWQIACKPYRTIWRGNFYVSLELTYGGYWQTNPVKFKFTLLDRAGEPVPELSRRSSETCIFGSNSRRTHGFHDFISWKDLKDSGCLNGDRFAVRCDVTVIKDWAETSNAGDVSGAAPASGGVPPSDLHEHLGSLLEKKMGTDVTIDLAGGGEEEIRSYEVHGGMLAARSPVLAAELHAAAEKKVPGGGVRRRVVVRDMEPKVFEAMLRFIYTDVLPEKMEEEGEDAVAMARGLLEAAHRYKLDRLKLMCEAMLCDRIGVDNVAGNLAVAEKHGCCALKDACLEFMASPGNLKAVMETEGYQKTKANCQAAIVEFAMRQGNLFTDH
ncbi:unnamed protein product [Urochloa decumbens]|uniref:BTB domain-containing protein n=1 Tax=Urochloa decumbens TaxID=240449 RepID=A0ABC9GDV8_9POAL